jgi:hypothetical protein
VVPPEAGPLVRVAESVGLPGLVRAEGIVLMGGNWRYSSRRARRAGLPGGLRAAERRVDRRLVAP